MLSENVVSILGQLIKIQNYMSKKGKFSFFASEVCYDLVPIHSNSLADNVSEPLSQVTQPVVNMETECREFDRITTLTEKENSPLT